MMCFRKPCSTGPRGGRRGVAAVEAAIVLPIVVFLLMGMWEVGQMIHVQLILSDATREGARMAAGGAAATTPVTVAMVQQAVSDYMTSAGIPTAAVTGAQISLTNLSSNTWTDPCDALPLDPFTVSVTIPAGAPFNSLKWALLPSVTGLTSMSSQTKWYSANDAHVIVSTTLPF